MPNQHDAFFKDTFSIAERARVELQSVLPVALSQAIAWDTLDLAPSELADGIVGERRADVLFTVEVAGTTVFLYVLFEHKSYVDPHTVLAMAGQVIRIWERCAKESGRRRALPAVLPILVHHSDTGWTAPTDLRDLIDVPAALHPGLSSWLPSFPVLLDDLSHQSEESLRSRASGVVALRLFAMQQARSGRSLTEAFGPAWAPIFAKAVDEGHEGGEGQRQQPMVAFLVYLVAVWGKTLAEVDELLRRMLGPDPRVGVIMDTIGVILQAWGKRYWAEGRVAGKAEGKAEGKTEGRAEGKTEGKAEILLEQLTARFGHLPPAIEARIRSAPDAEITTWAKRVLTATSLHDVLAET